MSFYKHPNGRITERGKNGRFVKITLASFGITANAERLICGKCGHGKRGVFFPIINTGHCPKCENQDGHIPFKDYLEDLIGCEFWFVTDYWETFLPFLLP